MNFVRGYVLNRFKLGSDKEITNIPLDSGKVLNLQGKQVAVYKDKDGNVKKVSGVCTHQGCIIDWNNTDKTWDCPCHGSRFTTSGEVINGPAEKPLEKLD